MAELKKAQNREFLQEKIVQEMKTFSPGFLSVSALLCALYSLRHLEPHHKITTLHGCVLFGSGAVFFTSLYIFLVRCAQFTDQGRRLTKTYKFSQADILDISTKIVSSVQALLCCVTGYVVWSHSCCRDLLRTNHYVSHAYTWFGAAYFFYDIWSMYRVHVHTPPGKTPQTPSTQCPVQPVALRDARLHLEPPLRFLRFVRLNSLIVGHHLFIGLFGFSVIVHLRGNLGDCVFGFIFLMEASTPFVALRSVLVRFGMKKCKLYIYNGFLMVIVFFLCRVAMFPYVMGMYARSAQLDLFEAIRTLPFGCKVSISVLMFPQLYWFYLMLKGALKIFNQKDEANKQGTTKN